MLDAQVVAARQVKFKKQIDAVKEYLETIEVEPESDIHIYMDYPTGWHAVVGSKDRIYVIVCFREHIYLAAVEPTYGFRPNGTLIRKGPGMEELLYSLKNENEAAIVANANGLFITVDGECNWLNINEFERFGICEVVVIEPNTPYDCPVGEIHYNGRIFSWGWLALDDE